MIKLNCEAVRQGMTDKHLSQKTLAETLHVTCPAVCLWLSGKARPGRRHRRQLAELLGLSIGQVEIVTRKHSGVPLMSEVFPNVPLASELFQHNR